MQLYQDTIQDRNGNVISSAVVTITDYPGGSASNVYATDAVGTNINPITADSDGQYEFYAVPGAYTLTVTKSGVTTESKVVTLGAAATSFLQSGTGAVSRSVQAKERDIVSVKDFGAVGDGTTNDYTAIQAAVTYALTQYGCAVYFPTGRYLVNSTVSIAGGIFLKGNGSYIINGQTNAAAMQFGDGVTRYYGGGIDGLYFTGKSGVVGVNGQYGLLVSKMGQMKFDNMRADASLSALYRPFYFSDVSQFVVNDIEAQGATLHGVSFINCTDGRINSGRSDANTGDGWSLNTSQGMIFTSCSAYNNTRYGWDL